MVDDERKKDMHFLVVDDDNESRKTIIEYLKTTGFEKISEASNGAQALKLIETDRTINFVISDWDMPLMNGLSLLQRVRANPNRAHTPFLIVTSPMSQEQEKVMLAAENMVNAYVIKPFRLHTLQEKIEKTLEVSVHGPQREIVIVDDDEDARAMVVEYMKRFGFKFIRDFPGGRVALEHLRKNSDKIGLIISDWEMPDLTGIELLRACKSDKTLKDIPFLMITSQGSMERMKVMQAAKAHVDHYLLKPFTSDVLKNRIEGLMAKTQNRSEVQKRLATAVEHADAGRYQNAKTAFDKVLEIDADNDMALRGLGDVLSKTKGMDAAMPYYKKAIDASPYNFKNYLKLADAYEHIGLLDKAIAALQTAISQISFSAELHLRLGELYVRRKMAPLARLEFEKVLQIEPQNREAELLLKQLSEESEE